MHWGHATSTDLVHRTQRPITLEPGVHPGDLWSGPVIDVTDGTYAGGLLGVNVYHGSGVVQNLLHA